MAEYLEYQSGNSLIRYPFKENCSFFPTSGNVQLDNGFFLEGVIVYKTLIPKRTYLKTIWNDGSSFHLTFEHLDINGSVVTTETIVIPFSSVIKYELFTCSTATFFGKFVPGQSFIDFKTGSTVSTSYAIAATEFSSAAIILGMPLVNNVNFYNLNSSNTSVLFHTSNASDVNIGEGANVALVASTSNATIDIKPNSGAGLYDGCGDIPGIKTINGVGVDKNQNFTLTGDDCYVFTPNAGKHGLEITNVCTPKCTPDQLTNFAHYLNRISNGMSDMVTYLGTIQTSISTIITDYNDTTLATFNSPWFAVKYVKTTAPSGCSIYTFLIGVSNPTNDVIDLTSMSVVATGTGSNFTLNDAEVQLGNTYTTSDPASISIEIPCKTQALVKVVLHTTSTVPVTVVISVPGFTARGDSTFTVPV